MQLNRFSLNQYRFKSLNTKSVKSWSSVEKNWMLFYNFIKNIPNFFLFFFDHFLSALNRGYKPTLFELVENKWLEQFQSHLFWKSTLVET